MRLTPALGLTLSLTTPVLAQPPATTTPVTGVDRPLVPATTRPTLFQTPLYQMNDVGKSLDLSPAQVGQLNALSAQTQARYQADYGRLGALGDAERFNRMHELNSQHYNDWSKGAGTVFTDAQRSRYQQLNYQYGGFNSFYDPNVQKQLTLTTDQQKNLRAQWDWSNRQVQDINRVGATDPARGAEMYRTYWAQRQERMNQFLSPEQQKTWRGMTGEPYTFRPDFGTAR